jgi:hypothetical protein
LIALVGCSVKHPLQFAILSRTQQLSFRTITKLQQNDLAMLNSTEVSSPNCQKSVHPNNPKKPEPRPKVLVHDSSNWGEFRSIGIRCQLVNRCWSKNQKEFLIATDNLLTFLFPKKEYSFQWDR